jgi:hypothetical protein
MDSATRQLGWQNAGSDSTALAEGEYGLNYGEVVGSRKAANDLQIEEWDSGIHRAAERPGENLQSNGAKHVTAGSGTSGRAAQFVEQKGEKHD